MRLGLVLFFSLSFFGSLAEAQVKYERPPILAARDVLPEGILKGPFHEVEPKVTSDGYFNSYKLK